MSIALVLLAFISNGYIVVGAFMLYFISSNLIVATLDIFIEDLSKHSSVGKFRGLFLTIVSMSWVISQIISGSIIAKSSYTGIYLVSAVLMLLLSGIFILFLHDFTDPRYKKISIKQVIKTFTHNKHLSRVYLLNFILKFFFAWMFIYTPIYLHETLLLGWEKIGFIFTIMLLPFVFLSYPLGKLSDKIGEKKMLKMGFLIAGFATLTLPFITTGVVWKLALVLFMTRIGAAIIEVMSESYFFKAVTEENADAISFFRNTTPVSFIIAPLVALPILYIVPSFKYIFFVLGAIMFLGYYITLRLRDIK